MNIGVLSSDGHHLDMFHPPLGVAWRDLGHNVFYAAGSPANRLNSQTLPAVTTRPRLRNLAALSQIAEWIEDNEVDVVVTNTAVASTLARIRRQSVPVVYFCHGLHWPTGRSIEDRIWQIVEKAMLRNTASAICMNTDDLHWFEKGLQRNEILYLRYGVGVPLAAYPYTPIAEMDCLRLLWAGEFNDRKRPGLMVDVARALYASGCHFHLTMLGTGRLRDQIEREVRDAGLEDHISTPGFHPLRPYLTESHFLIHTSAWEGLPRVMLEARAMGRQTIAFDVKGARDVPDVVLAPDGNPDNLAAIILLEWEKMRMEGSALPPPPVDLETQRVAGEIASFLEGVVTMAKGETDSVSTRSIRRPWIRN